MEYKKLLNETRIPQLGLGVWQMSDEEAIESVEEALKIGYRLIDTAAGYRNEAAVGEGVRRSGIEREDIWIATKVRNSNQGYRETFQAFEASLKELQMDYVDLYMVHWPVKATVKETWRAIEEIYQKGLAKSIGVCNFHAHHLEELMETAKILPMINQVELHPLLSQVDLTEYFESKGIVIEAYSPLGNGQILQNESIEKIAQKYQKTVAQIILRWEIQRGIVTIPKSVHKERIIQNFEVFDFTLSDEDMFALSALNQNQRVGTDPEHFEEIFAKKK
ncbi:oxidoreductase [Clostridia bacterium]|nr:oxidoreductase [Clostridia bacterium]